MNTKYLPSVDLFPTTPYLDRLTLDSLCEGLFSLLNRRIFLNRPMMRLTVRFEEASVFGFHSGAEATSANLRRR